MALIGWESANSGFNSALQTQAVLNVKLIFENMDVRYPGDWSLQDGKLYKGDHRFGDSQVVADKLGEICQGHVTFFAEDVSVSTNLKKANGERNVGTKASAEVADIVIKGNKEHSGMAAIDGIDYLGAYVPLRNASNQAIGMLFVGIGSYVMNDVRHQFLMVTVVASILVILILSVLSYVAIGRSLKPIEALTESLGRIAKGDLRVADLDESREDEIGILAHSANAMKNRLREVMSNVSRSAETVAASSEQLTASTQETLESITHVAQNTTSLAEGAAKQTDMIDHLAANADEMSDKMNQLAEQVSAAAGLVEALGRRSDEIGSIVDTISGISEQTNLLALNAAIEAARAGEAGRGFAVVAEEVRRLAEQAGESAKNIADLIHLIQNDTADAVAAIRQGNENVDEGASVVASSGEAFRTVAENFTELGRNIRLASDEVGVVSKARDDMIESLKRVEDISRKAADDTQTISAAAEEQAAAMHEMADASNTLATLAQELQNEVQKFHL
ncbi:methyl-accepting chemotaxis protein [Selenomonas sp. oral taxon 136]|uniref:methyl-accepting chemotaxis protein n=1 Tax=Selenomonas sp. oral taxon 136 TaxID=713030 RepID=UPI0009F8C19E|nr:methyl-accepting chemotaxis protein [Selenomonas sp. oral taxon 136]